MKLQGVSHDEINDILKKYEPTAIEKLNIDTQTKELLSTCTSILQSFVESLETMSKIDRFFYDPYEINKWP